MITMTKWIKTLMRTTVIMTTKVEAEEVAGWVQMIMMTKKITVTKARREEAEVLVTEKVATTTRGVVGPTATGGLQTRSKVGDEYSSHFKINYSKHNKFILNI